MSAAVLLAAATGLAVFVGFPLARRVAQHLVLRSDKAWRESSLMWLAANGGTAPEDSPVTTRPLATARAWMLRAGFSATGAALGYGAGDAVLAGGLALLTLIAAAAAVADLQARILPDLLTGLIGLGAVALSVTGNGPHPGDALIGMATAGTVFWLISRGYAWLRGHEGLGLGDVKLFAAGGLLVGWAHLPFAALLAVLLTLALSASSLRRSACAIVPFGPGIATGLLLILAVQRLGIL